MDPFTVGVSHYLIVGAVMFVTGVICMATKRNALGVLMGVELMLNSVNLTLVAFSRFSDTDVALSTQVFVIFIVAVAAAEVAVGLALAMVVYRNRHTVSVDDIDLLKW